MSDVNGRMMLTVKTSFEAFHCWPEALEQYKYLRHPHRHKFYVEAVVEVNEDNRQIEFLHFKQDLEKLIAILFPAPDYADYSRIQVSNLSCEHMARMIAGQGGLIHKYPTLVYVSVSEDNENGATFWITKDLPKYRQPAKEVQHHPPVLVVNPTDYEISYRLNQKENVSEVIILKIEPRQHPTVFGPILTMPFYGLEAEGPLVDSPTLFIPGAAKYEDSQELFLWLRANKMPIDSVYLGAGNSLKPSQMNILTYISTFKLLVPAGDTATADDFRNRGFFNLTIEAENLDFIHREYIGPLLTQMPIKQLILITHKLQDNIDFGAVGTELKRKNIPVTTFVKTAVREGNLKGCILSYRYQPNKPYITWQNHPNYKTDKTLAQLKEVAQ